ncbi:hypothetical protein ACHAP7_010678 [Fusarium lateritium]
MSAKTAIENLESRVLQLEGLLRQHNIEQPKSQEDASVSDTSSSATKAKAGRPRQQQANITLPSQAPNASSRSPSQSDNASPVVVERDAPNAANVGEGVAASNDSPAFGDIPGSSGLDDFGFFPQIDSGQTQQDVQTLDYLPSYSTQSETSPQQEPQLGNSSIPAREENLEDILSARMGLLRLSEDGQLRYYGPTSNLNIQNSGTQSLFRSTIRNVSAEGKSVLGKLGLNHPVSSSLETHLAKLYFSWEDPAIHVVDEEPFFREKEKYLSGTNSPYYSETLNNAICAIGACLAAGENLDVPEPAAEFFSMRAKAFLDIEMDSPTVATVQALVVMSASEAAFTRDARGWLYSGMAVRLCVDLGLHMDVTEHKLSGLLTQDDMNIRQTTFWGVFIHEHMWSLYVGRPWNMGIQNITVGRPVENHSADGSSRTWKPYPRAVGQSIIPDSEMPFSLEVCTAANIGLCEFMKRINATLYSGCMMGLDALVAFLSQTEADLIAWHNSLPRSLQIDPLDMERVYPPAVLQLKMQYNSTLISLYRPYLSKRLTQDRHHLDLPSNREALSNVAKSCVWAAHDIAETLRYHQKQHSLQKTNIQIVHIIFTASLIFIYDVCTRPYNEARISLNDLQLCCQALGEIGRCFSNATRALEVIIVVKGEWQKLAMAARHRPNPNLKRPSVQMSTNAIHSDLDDLESYDRPRRRARSSMSTADTHAPPMFFMPPSYHAYDNMFNSQTGSIGLTLNTEAFQDLWLLPQESEFEMGEIPNLMDWFDDQQFPGDIASLETDVGEGHSAMQDKPE